MNVRLASEDSGPRPRATSPVSFEEIKQKLGDDEPRPSYVLERLEGLILGGWLGDAVANLERVAESRMSEDLFDELRRIAGKIASWADEILRGNMFPRWTDAT